MGKPLLLDAFSCAGIGGDGYALAGFEVVGLDNDAKALKHNPYTTVHGDALELLADSGFVKLFDAIHASPPCQLHSATRELANAQGKGVGRAIDLLPQTFELLRRLDVPWVVENVERSPLRGMTGSVKVCGSAFGLKVQRHRLFKGNVKLQGTVCNHSVFDIDSLSGKPRPWGVYYAKGDNIPGGGRTALSNEHGHDVMGVKNRQVPWQYLCEGLPPTFTKFIGEQLMVYVNG